MISCDTFSNFPISDLYYNENIIDGKILLEEKIKAGRYTLKQNNIIKLI